MRIYLSAITMALMLLLLPSGLSAREVQAAADEKVQILSLFDQWNDSLASGEAGRVAGNYAPDAILLPTVSNKVRHNRAEITDYFEHFMALKPRGTIVESNIRIYGDIAINSGTYNFEVTRDGRKSVVKARFTFVYRKGADGKWLIVEHHSSALPEPERN